MKNFIVNIICVVTEFIANKIFVLYNLNVSNFKYTIDTDGKTHALKGHSGIKRILRAEEVPISEDDFSNLELYIKSSQIAGGGTSKRRGLSTVMHIYEKEHIITYVVFEILNKKKELRFKTMYKNKKHLYQQGS